MWCCSVLIQHFLRARDAGLVHVPRQENRQRCSLGNAAVSVVKQCCGIPANRDPRLYLGGGI
eukprot:4619556-Pyramimonas_sp.AAC.1